MDAYRVKLGSLEITPRILSKEFWHELAKGEAKLDYGDIRWGGGVVNPVLEHLIPAIGEVKAWEFVYKGDTDVYLQARPFETMATGAANTIERWFKLGLFALVATWGVILWRHGRLLSGVLTLWSNCICLLQRLIRIGERLAEVFVYQLQRLIRIGELLAEVLWNFWKTYRQAANLLVVLALWAAGIRYSAQVSANPLWGKLPYALTILTLFSGLNMWRWHLQTKASKLNVFLRCWIVGQGAWPPRVIWIVVVMTLALILAGVVSRFGQVTDIQNPGQFLSGMGVEGVALFASVAVMEIKNFVDWVPVIFAVFIGLAPWLGVWIYMLAKNFFQSRVAVIVFGQNRRILIGLRRMGGILIVFGLYAMGIMQVEHAGENYFLTLGNMAMVMIWYIWLGRMKEGMQMRWPSLAEKVYGGAGAVYFSGAVVGLVMTVMLLLLNFEWLAKQMTVIVYFCLVAGVAFEIVALRRAQHVHLESTPHNQSERTA